MVRSSLPRTWNGKIALVLLIVAYLAFAPPLVGFANIPELVVGFPVLYLWTLFWGSVMGLVLLWAAWTDAWGITMDQVPPELRDKTAVIGFTDTDRREPATTDEPATGEGEV